MRLKATIAYNGSKFFGFQRQKNNYTTVSETIELALYSLGIKNRVYGSGRTDRGVHASGQVIHFDIPNFWQNKTLNTLKEALNSKLDFIKILHLKEVSSAFHAQYSAKLRVYRYIIKRVPPTIFEKEFVSYYKINNTDAMMQALQLYRGKHNFSFFKKEGSPTTSNIRTIQKIKCAELHQYFIVYFFADGYLRSQVRMMLEGALKVANSELTLLELQEQIEQKKRYFTTLAKPEGLYLHKVIY